MTYWLAHDVIEAIMAWLIEMSSFLLGLYIWYLILSFHKVELELLTRKTNLRLVHRMSFAKIQGRNQVPYLLGRYAHLAMLLTMLRFALPVSLNPLLPMLSRMQQSCDLLWQQVTQHYRHQAATSLCALGSTGVTEIWDPDKIFCTIALAPRAKGAFLAYFVCTLVWDTSILALTVFGMRTKKLPPELPLRSVLLSQGIMYASITALTCIPMAISERMH
ncbi:uncharacterized protein PHACADRAFT_186994 [Phanerochaete carnosa HHB-10118-sp]|uniref:Uncharacterized protein n=1 Tax=Phanerochaete carnosa (strain HHB-10118-sp) TaxID=650164 RepID=K5WMK9_PHACS|nr:uncharacterized protein PHACADRAFT_186994 [Phanerochaete carnosa HHB-10118-sp]EKM51542.1 hypothetical protein PHACADRAFT_186994 [Phanerochaete carnosa HHB-10118-sp]